MLDPRDSAARKMRSPCTHWAGTQTGGLRSAHGLPPTRPSKRRQAAGSLSGGPGRCPPGQNSLEGEEQRRWRARRADDKRSTKQGDQESEAQAKLGVDGRERTVDPGLSPHTYSQLVSHSLPATTRWGRY